MDRGMGSEVFGPPGRGWEERALKREDDMGKVRILRALDMVSGWVDVCTCTWRAVILPTVEVVSVSSLENPLFACYPHTQVRILD